MKDYQKRLIQEHSDLRDKYSKLGAFIQSVAFDNVSDIEAVLLTQQHAHMGLYLVALCKRLDLMSEPPIYSPWPTRRPT